MLSPLLSVLSRVFLSSVAEVDVDTDTVLTVLPARDREARFSLPLCKAEIKYNVINFF